MAYQLACKECGTDISAHQYDAHLGMCPECFANEEDLHDESPDVCEDCGRPMYRNEGDGEDPHPNSCLACSCGMC